MHLADIGAGGILLHQVAVFDRLPGMGIPFHANPRDQADDGLIGFAEAVGRAAADSNDGGFHFA